MKKEITPNAEMQAYDESMAVDTVTKGLFFFFIGSMVVGLLAILGIFLLV